MDIEQARSNMINQQIRACDIRNETVLSTLSKVPREDFVSPEYRYLAFADSAIPLAHNQVMMTPNDEGRLLQALDIKPTDHVLEIGTGSGYLTALLAKLSEHVYSIDIFPDFTEQAYKKLNKHGIHNVSLITADASHGYGEKAPYNVIVLTGSLPILPIQFRHHLAVGGCLFAILGNSPIMEATLIKRQSSDQWSEDILFETDVPSLLNVIQPEQFTF